HGDHASLGNLGRWRIVADDDESRFHFKDYSKDSLQVRGAKISYQAPQRAGTRCCGRTVAWLPVGSQAGPPGSRVVAGKICSTEGRLTGCLRPDASPGGRFAWGFAPWAGLCSGMR